MVIKSKYKNARKDRVKILGIESSCDETSLAIVSNGLLTQLKTVSSIEELRKYNGVMPEVAVQSHYDHIIELLFSFSEMKEIDAIAVTCGPGMIGSLSIGVSLAKTLSLILNKPLYAVNHLIAHMFAIHSKENTLLSNGEFISLIVSGAHSSLLIYEQMTSRSLGDTLDDAPGEVFDKIAIEMGFSYPGGPIIDTIASGYNDDLINFPKAKIKNRDHKYDFSFSGVKSAIIRELERRRTGKTLSSTDKAKIASSAQRAICDALIEKTIKSTKENLQERIIVSGGVASNTYLRERLSRECDKRRIEIFFPDKKLCVDNGAMVAFLGEELFLNNIQPSGVAFDLYPELSVDKVVLAP